MMKRPKILLIGLWWADHIGLSDYIDVDYYNYQMPVEEFYKKANSADLIIEQEFNDGRSFYSDIMQNVKTKKAIWFIDKNGIFNAKPDYHKSYDSVYMAVDSMRSQLSRKSTHLPLAFSFPVKLMERISPDKSHHISFVGHIDQYPLRKQFFDRFKKDLDSKGISSVFKMAGWREYADIVQGSTIAFNKSQLDECNFRVFECMGFGSALLTDFNEECDKISELSDRAFYYNSYDDIFVKMGEIFSISPKKYNSMVKDNQKWILNNHLIIHRYLKIAQQTIGYENKRRFSRIS